MSREDWVECELREVSIFELGGDWGKSPDVQLDGFEEAYCIRGAEFKNWEKDRGKTASLRLLKRNSIEKRNLKEQDILVEISGGGPEQPVGRTVVIDKTVLSLFRGKNLVCTNFLRLVRPSTIMNSYFINQYLKFFYSTGEIIKYQAGSNNLRNLKFNDYMQITLPLPPIPIQRAIITKIENIFASLDKGIEDLTRANEQLKIYRQAVLKKAFEGDEKSAITNYVEKIQIGPFGSQLHKEDYIENGIPLINPMHLQGGKITPDSSYTISQLKRDSLPNYILNTGDVLMGRRGEMGRCGLVSNKESGWFCGTGSLYLRPIKGKILPIFLYYYLRSSIVKEILTGSAAGTTMMNLNKKIVGSLAVPVLHIEEQQQIVREIESRLSVCDKVEQSIAEALEKSKALRQSILKKAFEGRLLTTTEIEQCKKEADYEPASVLLQRIKREKAEA